MALDTALCAPNTLSRKAPKKTFAFVAIGGTGGRPHLKVVWCSTRDRVDQRLQGFLVDVRLQFFVVERGPRYGRGESRRTILIGRHGLEHQLADQWDGLFARSDVGQTIDAAEEGIITAEGEGVTSSGLISIDDRNPKYLPSTGEQTSPHVQPRSAVLFLQV